MRETLETEVTRLELMRDARAIIEAARHARDERLTTGIDTAVDTAC